MRKISVIVPIYNSAKNLKKCIESILGQTYKNFELILVNDGSTDDSKEIINYYASIDNRVIPIHQKNMGVSEARNVGLKIASGEYINFIDSDDYIDKNFFENAIKKIEGFELYISGLQMEYYEDNIISSIEKYGVKDIKKLNIKELFENLNIFYPQICICGPCCKLYKSSIIKDNNIKFNKSFNYGEDTLFNLDYFSKINDIYFDENIYYHYIREDKNSLFSKYHSDTYEVHEFIYNKMRELMLKINCSKNGLLNFENIYANLMLGCVHQIYKNSKDLKERKDIINKVSNNKYLIRCKPKDIKNYILLFLIKYKMKRILYFVFSKKYKN